MNHKERAHALLSASGASRWLACTPSAVLEDKMPESSSVFAEEGTLAHEFGDIALQKYLKLISPQKYGALAKKLKANKLYDPEMSVFVQDYVDYVVHSHRESGGVLLPEQKFDLTDWVPESFGTSDATIIADGTMEVIDYKHGKGIRVSADNNSQLKLYALGALAEFSLMYDIHTVKMTIMQPRMGNISSDELSVDELREWGDTLVKPRAKLAINGEGDFQPGDHCRFCKIAPTCRALANANMEVAKHDFAEPPTLSDKEILEVFTIADRVTKWLGQVSQYVLGQAIEGKQWEGFKLVEGRASRKITDVKAVGYALEMAGYESSEIYERKLLALTKLEKVVGKSKFNELVGLYVEKPVGNPKLVDSDDPRPTYNTINNDFNNEL